ncbi:MAG: S8 family peptidase [Anaerolineae bacterium]|nr:S8 family peptidase [Anaerolineae bacterium]
MDERPKLTRGLHEILRSASAEEAAAPAQIPIIVRYSEHRVVLRHREAIRGARESYRYRLRPFVHMHATPEAIRTLEANPEVVKIYEDLPVYAYLDTSVAHIQAPRVWEGGFTGENVRIAIVDTGLDALHPDFSGRIVDVTDVTGEGPEDGNGHGTHCASAAAGSGAASGGRYRGVASGASIYSAKVLRSNGEGMMSDVMAGVEWAVAQGVQIVSLSLGGPGPCDGTDALSEMCDAAVEAGVVLCVAAGNDGPSAYTVGSPGCAQQVITIGASDEAGHVAGFSSRGPTSDGRPKPDVVLPGVDIVAARARGTAMGSPVNEHYTSASGTSMATPQAAGLCALLLQAEPGLTPAQIKERLMATAIDLGADMYAQGRGRADAWRAWQNEVSPEPGPPPSPPEPPGPTPGVGCLTAVLGMLFPKHHTRSGRP